MMNAKSQSTSDWQADDRAHYLHPFTDHRALHKRGAMVMVRGQGCFVWDSDGNKYLDGLAGLACVQVGYGRRELIDAAATQMRELAFFNSFFKATNKPAIALATKLADLAPGGFEHVFYCNSGSEANDTCIRMVRHFWSLSGKPARSIIIGRESGYHGSTVAAAALSGMPPMHEQAAKLPDFTHIPAPYKFGLGRNQSEDQFATTSAAWLEEKILEFGPDRVAAFFAEPIQGAGGGKIPPPGYWQAIQQICKKYDVLLVVDEVVTGFGRTGAWFGSETFGIIGADLICLAKGITSGYAPLGAVMVGAKVASALIDRGGEFYHGFTYSGHPVSCAVALANIAVIEEEQLIPRVRTDTGPYFASVLQSLSDHSLVGETRSCGLLGAVELVADRETLTAFDPALEVGERLREIGLTHGIIVRPIGDTILMIPPLVISRAEIDFLGNQLRHALDELARQLKVA